jgi:hypothetical protein
LEGSHAKRNRAETHLKAIEQRIGEFLEGDPYPVTVEPYPEEGRYLVKLVNPKSLPAQELALLIGDCVHNMRSALDYIVWELAGADPSDRVSMFPIFDDEAKYKSGGARRIKRLPAGPDGPRALIERLQPYKAGKQARSSALWAIEDLDAADKHKLLTVTVPATRGLTVHFSRQVNAAIGINPAATLEHDAVIAVVTIFPSIPDVEVRAEFPPEISLGGSAPKFVIAHLKELLREVDMVTDAFARFF